jgi:hypothetical protein
VYSETAVPSRGICGRNNGLATAGLLDGSLPLQQGSGADTLVLTDQAKLTDELTTTAVTTSH